MKKLDYDQQDLWPFISGSMQSPVALNSQTAQRVRYQAPLKFDYGTVAMYVHDTGRGLEVGHRGHAILNNRHFELQQFHIHTPSEHTLDDRIFAAEIHFVNQAADGQLAVVAVFAKLGRASTVLDRVFSQIGQETLFSCDTSDLMPTNKSYFHYLGSLTTPPLSENVEWYVFQNPIEISTQQLAFLQNLYARNNRDLQPLKGRSLLYYEAD